ncbi:CAP domain-containing protein [Neobacillus mesonae]|uniref:CAP domain-containing protein n=1 Tax=Neobacillus mesonae TaxID=1193713 RepID=UPI002572E284|nr:CAP domain-containing protein [Neobacillus mesonae]
MIKKSAGVALTAMLTIGLAACNNNNKTGLNDINDRNDRVGMNVTNRDNNWNDFRNVRNDDWTRNNGPLTENFRNNDNDLNLFDAKNKTRTDRDMISAYQTTLNSDQYPQTKAVLIEDAKYQFIPAGNDGMFDSGFFQQFQPYLGQQAPAVKPPVQHAAPQPSQPAPKQTQPGPQQPAPNRTPVPKQTQPAPNQSPAPKQTQPAPKQPAATGAISQYAQQVINLTNVERRKKGLSDLKADSQLSGVAQKKADDMQQNHYFSHTSPTYGSPFDMMRDFGVTYKSAGENIAQGQRTPQEVVTAWMNSEGHRANILSTKYTHIGVGFEESGKHWSQMFIGK